ncbi:pilus assembly protein TadG-related protein [Demequina rhizosphaerae]|uniref:pilus assembly protein TadG-related protein n=1 Tax=Demequina rhizosphaerae TaxID=1638985 RepID=UPI000783ABD5|nr:pilus assembly protein TadG-related protein [Demequina rhizosphaerae]
MRRPAGDEGSVTVLTIGLAAVLLAAIVTVAAVTHVQLQRSRLAHAADEVSLAAADAIDLDAYYRGGVVRLDPVAVEAEARAQLAESARREGLAGAALVAASSPDGTTAEVTLALRTPVLFGATWLPGTVDLSATSSARAAP